MRRLLIAARINGSVPALRRLEEAARHWRPDAILFAGGVLPPARRGETVRSTFPPQKAKSA